MSNLREFSSEEIAEINNYVLTQIPQTILPQLFILTEEPIKKAKSFVAIYRIMISCHDYLEKTETKEKLSKHLNFSKSAYRELYELIMRYDLTELDLGKKTFEKKIIKAILDYNPQVNYVINTFLVFAEKMELISTETVSGIKMEDDFGSELYEQISRKVED